MIVKTNPEFGIELALTIPYAYYLHTRNSLKTVHTSKGMTPYYYFCDDVRETFEYRTIDNAAAGLNNLPNNWIHGIRPQEEPGVLDYKKWIVPPYEEYFKNEMFKFSKPTIFITNKLNLEHGETPYGFFDIECLYKMFLMLDEKGYNVIYKRSSIKEKDFAIDQNEINTLRAGYTDIKADVDGIGVVTDYEFTKYFPHVTLIDDLVKKTKQSYNLTQLLVMGNCEGFISVCGGNSVLSSMFKKPTISYVHKGKELRPNYFGPNTYFQKLSNNNLHPAIDVISHINSKTYGHKVNNTGKNDYSEVYRLIKELF